MATNRPAKLPDAMLLKLIREAERTGAYRFVAHAAQRLEERSISLIEIQHILRHGYREARKDEFKAEHKTWNYALRGRTLDSRELRLALTPGGPGLFIITAIDLTN